MNNSELRHNVYTTMSAQAGLWQKHYDLLIKRGLTTEQIEANGYASLPLKADVPKFVREMENIFGPELTNVPGYFYQMNHGHIVGIDMINHDGFLVPIRNSKGQINSFYIRKDNAEGSGKYVHFSAGELNKDVSLNPIPHSPLKKYNSKVLYLTEGPLKADVASAFLEADVLGLPGVTMWRKFFDVLPNYNFDEVCVVFDSDLERNVTVASATVGLLRELIKKYNNVTLGIWNPEFKGIDDALVAGEKITQLTTEESKNYLESVFLRLGKRKIDWSGTDELEISDELWGEIIPLEEKEIQLPEFTNDLIPKKILPWALDLVERMQCPLEYVLVTYITFLSGVIGRKITVKPKRNDNWILSPHTWGLIIGPPSSMKSPVFSSVKKVLDKINNRLLEEYQESIREWKAHEIVLKMETKSIEDALKKLFKSNRLDPMIEIHQSRLLEIENELEVTRPKRKILLINDSTIEKVQEDLFFNTNGVIVCRDEMSGFFMSLEKTGRESDRAFYLEGFNGLNPFRISRIARGDFIIPANCLTLLGGIQPDVLGKYFFESNKNGNLNDGMIQRFQLMVYPSISKEYNYVDRSPNKEAEDEAFSILTKCFELKTFDNENEEPPSLMFDQDAQALFKNWIIDHENKLRAKTIRSSFLESHLGKFKKLIPSLALIFHIMENIDSASLLESEIGFESIDMAIKWSKILERHAYKIYEADLAGNHEGAKELYNRIKNGDVRNKTAIREIYRKNWTQLDNKIKVYAAILILKKHNIARVEMVSSDRGAPSYVIEVNPLAIPIQRKATDKSDIDDFGTSVSSYQELMHE